VRLFTQAHHRSGAAQSGVPRQASTVVKPANAAPVTISMKWSRLSDPTAPSTQQHQLCQRTVCGQLYPPKSSTVQHNKGHTDAQAQSFVNELQDAAVKDSAADVQPIRGVTALCLAAQWRLPGLAEVCMVKRTHAAALQSCSLLRQQESGGVPVRRQAQKDEQHEGDGQTDLQSDRDA